MIEPTDEMVQLALDVFLATPTDSIAQIDDGMRDALATVFGVLARDRCLERRGHVFHPLAKRDQSLPLSVGRIQSYCGGAPRPHAGHVWVTEPGRWCPGDEARS